MVGKRSQGSPGEVIPYAVASGVFGWATSKAQQDRGQTLAASPKSIETGSHTAGLPSPPGCLGDGGQALAIGGGRQKGKFACGIYPFMNPDYGPEPQRGVILTRTKPTSHQV